MQVGGAHEQQVWLSSARARREPHQEWRQIHRAEIAILNHVHHQAIEKSEDELMLVGCWRHLDDLSVNPLGVDALVQPCQKVVPGGWSGRRNVVRRLPTEIEQLLRR